MRSALFCVAALLLAACDGGESGGGGDDDGPYAPAPTALCRSIGGGGATITTTSAGGSVSDAVAAVDGDFATYATVTIETAGASTLRGRPQSGVVTAAGTPGGVLLERPHTAQIGIRAYLGEAPVASCLLGAGNVQIGPCRFALQENHGFIGVETELEYDSLEISVQAADGAVARIFEFCTRE